MNFDTDRELEALEAELSALTPSALPSSVRQEISRQLAQPRSVSGWRRCAAVSLGLSVAAALAMLVLPIKAMLPQRPLNTETASHPNFSTPPFVTASPRPDWWSYRQALVRSPENLNALLEVHAQTFSVDLGRDEKTMSREINF